MARARFGGRGGAVGTEATRGRALSSAQTGNPIVPDSRRSILGAARAAVAARRAARHERAAALGRLGEAAGHARAKANTRRIARGEGRRRGGRGRGIPECEGGSLSGQLSDTDGASQSDLGLIKKSAFGTTLSRSRATGPQPRALVRATSRCQGLAVFNFFSRISRAAGWMEPPALPNLGRDSDRRRLRLANAPRGVPFFWLSFSNRAGPTWPLREFPAIQRRSSVSMLMSFANSVPAA